MTGIYTILLLICSNIFMTLAWYGHLKLQQTGVSSNWPLFAVFSTIFFQNESLHWNHIAAFGCLLCAVYLMFMK